jgi:hypothetical protein
MKRNRKMNERKSNDIDVRASIPDGLLSRPLGGLKKENFLLWDKTKISVWCPLQRITTLKRKPY